MEYGILNLRPVIKTMKSLKLIKINISLSLKDRPQSGASADIVDDASLWLAFLHRCWLLAEVTSARPLLWSIARVFCFESSHYESHSNLYCRSVFHTASCRIFPERCLSILTSVVSNSHFVFDASCLISKVPTVLILARR